MAKYAGMTDDELAAEIARLKAEIEIRMNTSGMQRTTL